MTVPDTQSDHQATARDEIDSSDLTMLGAAALAGPANVIMQLAMPAVGYGVYESRVDSGNLFKHPVKRTRTTLSYLAVAAMGSPSDRRAYRRAVGRAHARVHSTADSPVAYNAFDPALQLWVAACLYKGWEDVQHIYGDPSIISEETYRAGAVMGTTLQVPQHMWPATRADFETYWQNTVSTLEIDPPIREHLLAIARMEFAGPVVSRLGGWWSYIMTIGFLPEDFRDKMDVEFTPRQQTIFDVHNAIVRRVVRHLPKPLQQFPFNVLLADVRRRIRTGRPLV